MNVGGRVRFVVGAEVRLLKIDGSVSTERYVIQQARSDRKGHIEVREKDGTQILKVHHRRVLAIEVGGKVCVIEAGDKYWVVCPHCQHIDEIETGSDRFSCPKCSRVYPCHWIGVRPMAETAKKIKPTKTEKKPREPQPRAEKAKKAVKEAQRVDIAALAKLEQCELYTKRNIRFDHARIDVRAHVLLFVGTHPRKLCFNTYNGTLGKRSTELPIEEFVHNRQKSGKKNNSWFPVADVETTRTKLVKAGYEKN